MSVSNLLSVGNAIRLMVIVGLVALSGVIVQSCQRPKTGLDVYANGSLHALHALETPPAQPRLAFQTENGDALTLADFKGQVILVNIWATWCPPCVAEMPSLDRLQNVRGGTDFQVVTISIDNTPDLPVRFFKRNDIQNLIPYHDPSFSLNRKLEIGGLPTSVIYNRNGREVARLTGDAQWDSPEALALIDAMTQP